MMPTIAMATSWQSPLAAARHAGLADENDPLPVVDWSDQVIDALGHDPRSEYVQIFRLPITGPSYTLSARLLAA